MELNFYHVNVIINHLYRIFMSQWHDAVQIPKKAGFETPPAKINVPHRLFSLKSEKIAVI
jgi:hypothetical protein